MHVENWKTDHLQYYLCVDISYKLVLPEKIHTFPLTDGTVFWPPPPTSTWISKTAWARPPLRISKFKDPPQITVNTFINDLVFFTGIIFSANEGTTYSINNHEWWSLSKLSSTASLMTQPGTSLRSGRKRQKTGSNRKNITLLQYHTASVSDNVCALLLQTISLLVVKCD